MKTTLAYVLEQVLKELDFLSDESIWTDGHEKKVILRATSVAQDAEAYLESLEDHRKSSVYMDVKNAFKCLFHAMLILASRKYTFGEDRWNYFKTATAEFKEAKEKVLTAL